jgi:3-methyl-2-oxobutanoate hydroxymethyltransferase
VTSAAGYRAKGRDAEQALAILDDAWELERAGCAALVVEAVPNEIASLLTSRARIPVIGIGAGIGTNGQVLVFHDLLGFTQGRMPRFVTRYAEAQADLAAAARRWADDVREGRFPTVEQGYPIAPEAGGRGGGGRGGGEAPRSRWCASASGWTSTAAAPVGAADTAQPFADFRRLAARFDFAVLPASIGTMPCSAAMPGAASGIVWRGCL